MAAKKGNTYSSKNNRLYTDTLKRIAIQGNGKKMRAVCEALFDKAESGDVAAIREIGDRLEGKAAQTTTLDGNLSLSLPRVIQIV